MLIIEDDVIYITKGDDAAITVDVDVGDEIYVMDAMDILTMTVREKPEKTSPALITIRSQRGSNRIVIDKSATKDVEPGKYSADIQLTTASRMVQTIWPVLEGSQRYRIKNWGNFVVMPEVTYDTYDDDGDDSGDDEDDGDDGDDGNEESKVTITDDGDGTVTITGVMLTDAGDGVVEWSGASLTDTGDGVVQIG